MKLPERTRAVITGAGSGLGRAFALQLARQHARMVLADINVAGVEETARLAQEQGAEAMAVKCDVSVLSEVEALAQRADDAYGGTDLLINNAGVAVAGVVGELPIADWEWILRINLWGVIHGCHAFVPRLRAQGRGFILNVASSAGFASLPEMAPYNVTKAAVISLSETLHAELGSANVAVSCLCPTFFKTGLLDTFRGGPRQRALAHRMFAASSMTADEVARAGLRGVQKGRLLVIPQHDGTLMWRVKRWMPGLYAGALRTVQKRNLLERLTPKSS